MIAAAQVPWPRRPRRRARRCRAPERAATGSRMPITAKRSSADLHQDARTGPPDAEPLRRGGAQNHARKAGARRRLSHVTGRPARLRPSASRCEVDGVRHDAVGLARTGTWSLRYTWASSGSPVTAAASSTGPIRSIMATASAGKRGASSAPPAACSPPSAFSPPGALSPPATVSRLVPSRSSAAGRGRRGWTRRCPPRRPSPRCRSRCRVPRGPRAAGGCAGPSPARGADGGGARAAARPAGAGPPAPRRVTHPRGQRDIPTTVPAPIPAPLTSTLPLANSPVVTATTRTASPSTTSRP